MDVEDLADTYSHALTAYAMALYKPGSRFAGVLIEELMKKAVVQGSYIIAFYFIELYFLYFETYLIVTTTYIKKFYFHTELVHFYQHVLSK